MVIQHQGSFCGLVVVADNSHAFVW